MFSLSKFVVIGDIAHAFLPYHYCTESNEILCLDFPYTLPDTLMHQDAMIFSAEKMFIIKSINLYKFFESVFALGYAKFLARS